MELIALDDFLFSDVGIPPATLTNQSQYLGFGVERRSGAYSSVFFGATAEPATWHVVIHLPDDAARDALLAVLAGKRRSQFRLLAQRDRYGADLVVTEAAISGQIDQPSAGALIVNFESNDSVWFATELVTVGKRFTSPLDQILHLPVSGHVPTSPIIHITPLEQRGETTPAVGWRLRRRFAISHEGDEPLFRYAAYIPLGDTAAKVSAGKARADGADLRVWLHGLEQARSLVDWNTAETFLLVIVPVLPPGQSLTYEVVYGHPLATLDDSVELVYPDRPAFDVAASTNYAHVYRTSKDIANGGQGLWPLSSALEGGSADYGVPGAWQPALTHEYPNNTDSYVQPRAQRLGSGASEWYQARLYASRWRGPGFADFAAYAGSDPFDGVTIHNPLGIRAVHSDGVAWRNDAAIKTVVTTTIGDTTESTEVLVPHDPPFTRVVVIGRSSGGEGWHVLQEYGWTVTDLEAGPVRLYLPSSGVAPIAPTFNSGWENTSVADRLLASRFKGATPKDEKFVTTTLSSGADLLLRQYILPLPAGVVFSTSDTVKGQIRAHEVGATGARAQIVIRVMTSTSVVRATLLNFDTGVLSSEFPGGAPQNRRFPRGGAVNLATNYTTVSGDYLVIEIGARAHNSFNGTIGLYLGEEGSADYPEDETSTATNLSPWIQFSNSFAPPAEVPTVMPATWTPPRPLKHFGLACWPAGGVQIPEDAESRVFVTSDGDMTVYVAAESLFITEIEPETEIYELATELRLHGGANAAGPYDTLLVGNARQRSGPGTPRASLALGTQALQIDTERHTHTIWDPTFTRQQEALSAHVVRALSGTLRVVDATEVPALQRIPVTIPNSTFDVDLAGWELEQDDGDWTYTVTHDAAVGGAALGSLKIAMTVADAGTILLRSATSVAVEAQDSVEVTAWVRQAEGGASSPRLGVVWYNAPALVDLATHLDQLTGVTLTPGIDHQLVFTGVAPAGATHFRVVLGVTAIANAPGTKWFDDLSATIVRPLRYDAETAKVTEEVRASQWLPLSPPRQTLSNGAFDVDLSSWELADDGTGITHTAEHDPLVGGEQDGSLKISITGNTGSDGVAYLANQYFELNGQERVEMSAWVRTSDPALHPRLAVYWYQDGSDAAVATALEPAWADDPDADEPFGRSFAAIAPPGATRFRLAVVADAVVAEATGTVWFDDIRLNDNDLVVADVAMGDLDVVTMIRPRWVP